MNLDRLTLQLVDDIYAASIDPSQWEVALNRITSLIGANHHNLVIERLDERTLSYVNTSGFDTKELEKYNTELIELDELGARLHHIECGEVIDSSKIMTRDELESLEIHECFYHKAGMDMFLGVNLHREHDCLAYFSLARDFNSSPFNEQSLLQFQLLIPHLQRSLFISNQLLQKETVASGYLTGLNELSLPTILLNKKGQIVSHTHSASSFLAKRVNIQRCYPIKLPTDEHTRNLHSEIHKALSSSYQPSSFIHFCSEAINYKAVVFGWEKSFERNISFDQDVACIVMIIPESSPTGKSIQRLFNLSNAETRIVEQIAMGLVVKEISSKLFTSEANVRFHIKNILRKSNCRNQNQLITTIYKHLSALSF